MSAMITLLIPTQNRPLFLERALDFYARAGCRFKILVCDSSDAARKDAVAAVAAASGLNVELHRFEYGISINQKLIRGLELVQTPCMAFAGDDDFIVPDSIERCVAFLDVHEDFAVAHGRSFTFTTQNSAVNGLLTTIRPYRQVASERPTPMERLEAHFTDWTTSFYSVQRTRNVREILEGFQRLDDDITACEVYFYATNVIRGKAAKLDCQYMYRQVEVTKEYSAHETHVWASAPGLEPVRRALVREIAGELSEASGITVDEGMGVVAALIARWVESRRPYHITRWAAYPATYYWDRLQNLGYKLGAKSLELVRPSRESALVKSVVQGEFMRDVACQPGS